MEYVRSIDFDTAEISLKGGYRGKILYFGESCVLIATKVPPSVRGPKSHTHPVDQIYFVMSGDVTLELGGAVCTAGPGSAVFIPAGVPHCNWNAGDEPELHLEILAPAGLQTLMHRAERADAAPAVDCLQAVIAADQTRSVELEAGMMMTPLVGRRQGCTSTLVYIADLPPGSAGPNLHVHEFDQFYLVLDGVLSVQVGLNTFSVAPGHIAVLPAGVPHRQWNSAAVSERHLTIIAPGPKERSSATKPWDIPVELLASSRPSAQ